MAMDFCCLLRGITRRPTKKIVIWLPFHCQLHDFHKIWRVGWETHGASYSYLFSHPHWFACHVNSKGNANFCRFWRSILETRLKLFSPLFDWNIKGTLGYNVCTAVLMVRVGGRPCFVFLEKSRFEARNLSNFAAFFRKLLALLPFGVRIPTYFWRNPHAVIL